jgi:archaellum biogenesis ATPase FlaH
MTSIDYAINDLSPGCVSVIVGRTNAGKTTFTKQIISNAINNGNKVFCVSGEGDQEVFINEIYKNVIGRNQDYFNTVKINKRFHKEPKPEVLTALQKWHKGKLVVFSKGESKLKSMNELFEMIAYEIKIKKHDLIIIDNMMSLLTTSSSKDKNESQGDFIQKCCDMAKIYSTHIIVVVHPKKPSDGRIKDIDIENISGSMDIGNKADNIISVSRNKQEEGEEFQEGGNIEIIKNRYYSEMPKVETHFDKDTGLLLEINNIGNAIGYKFDWQKYLDKKVQLDSNSNLDIFNSNPNDPF